MILDKINKKLTDIEFSTVLVQWANEYILDNKNTLRYTFSGIHNTKNGAYKIDITFINTSNDTLHKEYIRVTFIIGQYAYEVTDYTLNKFYL